MAPDPAPRRPVSLALRLTLSIGIAITLAFWALGWVIERAIERHFIAQDAEELEEVANSVRLILSALPPSTSNKEMALQLAGAVKGHHGMYYRVDDAQGRTLFATPGPVLKALPLAQGAVSRVDLDNLHVWQEQAQWYRGAVVAHSVEYASREPQHYTVVVATGTAFHDYFLSSLQHTVWAATLATGLIAIFATWLAVYRGHAPLRDMSAQIRGISADQLHLRLAPERVPVELSELATSFNAMLEHIEQDFRRLSNFSADIAHELRTPVTNLITQTQVLLIRGRSADVYREVLYSNLEEYERMAKMIGDMLYLAQTDNQLIKPDLVDVDLSSELDALFEYLGPWAEEHHVKFKRTGHLPAVRGDRWMLRRALSNLLSNAVRYTNAGGSVTVSLTQDQLAAIIRVSNPGEDIPAEHLGHLFDRFYRADPSRQRNGDGAGLGLAIVKSIVEAHGGGISVSSNNGVTVFELHLPREPADPHA